MRNLFLLTLDFPPRYGGVARYLHELAVHFQQEIFVVAPREKGSEVFDASVPYPVEREELLSSWMYPRWIKIIFYLVKKKNQYQTVLVSHLLPIGTAAWIASFFTKKSYIIFLHGLDVALAESSWMKRFFTRHILCSAKLVVTNSQSLCDEVKKKYHPKQMLVMYPCPSYLPPEEGTPISGRLVTVARLVERKGHLRVLEALALLRKQNRLENIQYRIVGNGPMYDGVMHGIHNLGLEDIVSLEREANDEMVRKVYETTDLFVMPTIKDSVDREGFGLVYLEAAAYGIPSIATDQPGVEEAVIDKKTGILIPDGDIETLAETIFTLVKNRSGRMALGKAARMRVREQFNLSPMCEKLRSFL